MPMRIRLLALLLFFSCCSLAQTSFRVMSYNVENLFDCDDDSLTFDEDFTPEGAYHWTPNKLKQKIAKIAKVTIAESKVNVAFGLVNIPL